MSPPPLDDDVPPTSAALDDDDEPISPPPVEDDGRPAAAGGGRRRRRRRTARRGLVAGRRRCRAAGARGRRSIRVGVCVRVRLHRGGRRRPGRGRRVDQTHARARTDLSPVVRALVTLLGVVDHAVARRSGACTCCDRRWARCRCSAPRRRTPRRIRARRCHKPGGIDPVPALADGRRITRAAQRRDGQAEQRKPCVSVNHPRAHGTPTSRGSSADPAGLQAGLEASEREVGEHGQQGRRDRARQDEARVVELQPGDDRVA